MPDEYFLVRSFWKNVDKIWKKTVVFSRRLQPDWGNIARAAKARLLSKGLMSILSK